MKLLCIVYLSLLACELVSFYFLYRNNWIYKKRVDLLDKDINLYMRVKSYKYMLYRKFWVWNFDKLTKL